MSWPFIKMPASGHADVIIIGAQRCGTTSLFEYLSAHPDILPASRKEVHYFDNNFDKGNKWYSDFFPSSVSGKLRLEASPYYIFHPHVAARIADNTPDIKLILLIRDPVERAYSHFKLIKKLGREPLTFVEALEQEKARLEPEIDRMHKDPSYSSPAHQNWSYISRGHYQNQIDHWEHYFSNGELLILKMEELASQPNAILKTVTEHLKIEPLTSIPNKIHNHIEGVPMDATARKILNEHFKNNVWYS